MGAEMTAVCCAAPEDIRAGSYVMIMQDSFEFYPWCAARDSMNPPTTTTLVRMYPDKDAEPMRVISVCLPFLHVQTRAKRPVLLDGRRMRLGVVDRHSLVDMPRACVHSKSGRSQRKRTPRTEFMALVR